MNPDHPTEHEPLTPEEAARVDKTCDEFERAWQAAQAGGTVPHIERYLEGCAAHERTILILELVALDRACRERYGVALQPEIYEGLGAAAPARLRGDTRAGGPDGGTWCDRQENWPRLPGLELLEVLGSGGMGVVFKAWQVGLERFVAVKLMRDARLANAEDSARFRQEARAVASLQHAHLVQVYEFGEVPGASGTTAQPYLVLEYVAGGSLADLLRGAPQAPAHAAQLVETLADAIHYAHMHGIVHRDLKPGNVLLADEATPKITDFGLAKFLGGSDLTRTGDVLGTPSYMAPEQTVGNRGAVAPAVDVYGLGAILYEVLTGRPPFLAATTIATVLQVQQEQPVPPRRLQPTVPRDLETICLKCLHKEASRRYATAQALADDLRRFRAGEPIQARPVSSAERVVRWCRRKPAVAGLLAALVLVVFGGFAGIFWQWRRAEANAGAALQTAGALKRERDNVVEQWERAERHLTRVRTLVDRLTRIANDLADQPGLDQTGRALLQEALLFHQEVMQEKSSDPEVRLATARAFGRVASIHHTLRQWREAEAAFSARIDLMDALHKEFPDTVAHRIELAHAYRSRAHVLRDVGKAQEARGDYDRAIALEEALLRDNPTHAGMRIALASTLLNSGGVLPRDDADERERRHLRAVRLQKEAVALFPKNRGYRQELALGLTGIAGLHFQRGEMALAEDMARQALELHQLLHDEARKERWFELYLAQSHRQLALILGTRKPAQAELQYKEAFSLLDGLIKDFPTRPIYRIELAEALVELARLLNEPGRLADVQSLLGQALSQYDRLAADHPTEPGHLRQQAAAALLLGQRLKANGKYDEAQKAFGKMLAANERLILQFNGVPGDRYNKAWDLCHLSDVCELGGKPADAEQFMRQALQEFRQLVHEFPRAAAYRQALTSRTDELPRLLRKAGKLPEAIEASRAAVADRQQLADMSQEDPARGRGLAHSLGQQGDLLRADRQYAEAAVAYRAAVRANPDDPRTLHALASFLLTCPEAKVQAPAEARDLAQRANQLAPGDAAIWNTLGMAYLRTGNYPNAITALVESARIRGATVDWFSLTTTNTEAATRWLKNQQSVPSK